MDIFRIVDASAFKEAGHLRCYMLECTETGGAEWVT